jgi:C1A family cysteine protease
MLPGHFPDFTPDRDQASSIDSCFDWREKGIMTPVKNQGDHGTCWAFASVGLLEALIAKETGKIIDLSEQYLISHDIFGPVAGLQFLQEYGTVSEQKCPYAGKSIVLPEGMKGNWFLNEYMSTILDGIPLKQRISEIKKVILEYGPVISPMNLYVDFCSYHSGVYVYDGKSREQPGGHIILICGWVNDPAVKNGGYWIVKNSAGKKWGEKGYGRCAVGEAGIDDFYIAYGIYNPRKEIN